MLVYVGLLGLTYYGFKVVPLGFIPSQDKGYLIVNAQLPDAASLERSVDTLSKIEQIALKTKGVAHTVTIGGYSMMLSANGSNFASMFVILDEFDKRESKDLYFEAIQHKLTTEINQNIQEALVGVFGAPPVDGIGNALGFKMMVEDRGNAGLPALQGQVENLIEKGRSTPGIGLMFSQFRANVPQLFVDIDRVKCKSMGISLNEVFGALQVYLGGYYVNDFNDFGRTWQVNLQADEGFRVDPDQVARMKVRSNSNQMVPLGSLAKINEISGPIMITRYNTYPAAALNGIPAPGYSSAQTIRAMAKLAEKELPGSMIYEWTELTFLQIKEGNTAVLIFPLCLLFVFLTHSAEYESWGLPLGIILIVPMSLLCALIGVHIRNYPDDIFVQIGFIVLVGLACKNAVLIIEFAKQQEEHEGLKPFDAALKAATLRLRPILMTSFAFILGVVPLMLAKGAGFEMRRTLGTAVFAGMLGVTIFGVLLTPVFYRTIRWLSRNKPLGQHHHEEAISPAKQPEPPLATAAH